MTRKLLYIHEPLCASNRDIQLRNRQITMPWPDRASEHVNCEVSWPFDLVWGRFKLSNYDLKPLEFHIRNQFLAHREYFFSVVGFGPIIKKNQIRGGKVLIPIDLAGIYSSFNTRKDIDPRVPLLYD